MLFQQNNKSNRSILSIYKINQFIQLLIFITINIKIFFTNKIACKKTRSVNVRTSFRDSLSITN